mgnify:CR=1 FL=1
MTSRYTKPITDWLIKCKAINTEDAELYSYALKNIVLMFSPIVMALLFGLVMNSLTQSIVMILPFMTIRKFSGGYHTKYLWSCLIGSSLLLLLCILTISYVSTWVLFLLTVAASLSLVKFSPIEHENRRLEKEECTRYKKWTTIGVTLYFILSIVLMICDLNVYAGSLFTGIILTGALQIPCIMEIRMFTSK